MPEMITVYPTKKSALSIPAVPGRPKLAIAGALWPHDSFTMRRLADGSVTADPNLAYQPPVAAAAASAAPAAASASTSTAPAATPAPASAATTSTAPAAAPSASTTSAPAAAS